MYISADITIEYNDGISSFPVSQFVDIESIENREPDDISGVYDALKSRELYDVIFYGDVFNNREALKWITSRLFSEDFNISIYSYDNIFGFDNQYNVILGASYEYAIKAKDIFSMFAPRDSLILNIDKIEYLQRVRKILLEIQFKSKVFFNTKKMNKEIVLENRMYDLIPYSGNLPCI